MLFARLLTWLFWLQCLVLAVGLTRRARRWRKGRPERIDWTGLLSMPKRYFVDLHRVVAREPYIAQAHVATAGGAVMAVCLVALNYGFAWYLPALDWAIAAAALVMLIGTTRIWARRLHPPERLSRGAWMRLPYTLACLAVGLMLLSLVPAGIAGGFVAALALILTSLGSAELALGIGTGGPMKHAVAGLLHLAFHPRPERFAGQRAASAVLPLHLNSQPLGVGKLRDFRWNQLLGFDACVQCGKCEAACPAFAAGQPLSPKRLIRDLVLGHDLDGPIVPNLIAPETLWSCTTCRACVEECPMLIEHVDAIIAVRRYQTLNLGDVPGQGPGALQNLRHTETVGGYSTRRRYDWGVDLNVRVLRPGDSVEYLLIAGEGAYDLRYQRTLRALVQVLQAAQVDFAILGSLEPDCGDLARRLGDEATFHYAARSMMERLAQFRFTHVLTADPHVLHCLRNEYPAMGAHYDVVHHTALIERLISSGKLKLRPAAQREHLTYHDPCYLSRYNGETEAPRAILRSLGIPVTEMKRSGRQGRCCGGGGGAPWTDIPGKRRIPDLRMDDAHYVGAQIVAVACPGCTAMFEGVVEPRPEVLDIAELVAAAATTADR